MKKKRLKKEDNLSLSLTLTYKFVEHTFTQGERKKKKISESVEVNKI